MKKLLSYLLLLSVASTSCSSDDNTTYTKITQEEKELVHGDWQLVLFRNFYEEVDLVKERMDVFYQFRPEGTLAIKSESSNAIDDFEIFRFLNEAKSLQYTFRDVRDFDNESLVQERIHLYNADIKYAIKFNIKISNEAMTFSKLEGDSFLLLEFV